ncbi:unnamed protein product [Prunus brigantina]
MCTVYAPPTGKTTGNPNSASTTVLCLPILLHQNQLYFDLQPYPQHNPHKPQPGNQLRLQWHPTHALSPIGPFTEVPKLLSLSTIYLSKARMPNPEFSKFGVPESLAVDFYGIDVVIASSIRFTPVSSSAISSFL